MPRTHKLLPLVLLVLAACTSSANTTGPLIAAPTPYITDVPLPAGFYIADDSTTTYIPNQYRIAHHHYKGHDDYIAVAAFYREQLPLKDWTLLSEQHNGNTIVLTLSKPSESLVITISSDTFFTNIRLNLDPTSHATPTAPVPPG